MGEGLAGADDLDDAVDVAAAEIRIDDAVADQLGFGPAAVAHGVDQRHRRLALEQVVADVLAHGAGVPGVVEGVVDQLEGRAEMPPDGLESLFDFRRRPGEPGAALRRGLEQDRGFVVDHLEITRLGDVGIHLVDELLHLALGDAVGGVGHDFHDAHVADADEQLESPGIDEIADEHARFGVPLRVDRGPAPAQGGHVHHIVVEQGGGVDEFDHRGELDMAVVADAAASGREQHQNWPQPLAAGFDDVMADAFREADPGMQLLDDGAVYGCEVVFNRREKLREHRVEGHSLESGARRAQSAAAQTGCHARDRAPHCQAAQPRSRG